MTLSTLFTCQTFFWNFRLRTIENMTNYGSESSALQYSPIQLMKSPKLWFTLLPSSPLKIKILEYIWRTLYSNEHVSLFYFETIIQNFCWTKLKTKKSCLSCWGKWKKVRVWPLLSNPDERKTIFEMIHFFLLLSTKKRLVYIQSI